MASEVVEELRASDDQVERELGEALLKWQDVKASRGLPRSLGYEPKEIREKGAVAVIESRVLKGSAGFDAIHESASYEAIVDRHPDRFRTEVITAARRRLQGAGEGNLQIPTEDALEDLNLGGAIEFSQRLSKFLRCYDEKRAGSFSVDAELKSAMKGLQDWLERIPGECHELCVTGPAHAGFSYGHASKRSSNMIAN